MIALIAIKKEGTAHKPALPAMHLHIDCLRTASGPENFGFRAHLYTPSERVPPMIRCLEKITKPTLSAPRSLWVRTYAGMAALCDFWDSGWGDPGFPHCVYFFFSSGVAENALGSVLTIA